jgi:hypothetical protein
MPRSIKTTSHKLDQNGQTLIEFVLLLLVLVSLSFTLYRGFNYTIAERWKGLVNVIASPTTTPIEL